MVDRITDQVSGLRGLPVTEAPPTFFISPDRMAENVREIIEEEYTREEADIEAQILALMDFIEPGTDLKQAFADLYAGSVVGYYDTDTGEMFVLNTGDSLTPAAKSTLAHELVHALQDQAFDLDAFLPEDEENDDLERAKVALVEGDAVLASSQYVNSFLTRSEIIRLYSSNRNGVDLSNIPRVLIRLLTFPYREGAVFVAEIHDDGGWESVDAAYSHPPLSTEHILHPGKYFSGEGPVPVSLPDLGSALGPGGETLGEGTLGEFMITLYLENRLTRPRAAAAAEGWGGDAYALLRNAGQDESVLVSLSAWDSVGDAHDFYDAMASYFEVAGPQGLELTASDEGLRAWGSDSRDIHLALSGDEVLLIISESGAALEAIAARFPDFPS